jgi:hypothetical protein
MITDFQIKEPLLFNPLKHHLGFIKGFINLHADASSSDFLPLTKEIKHIGGSVMDIYAGTLSVKNICREVEEFLIFKNLLDKQSFAVWAGIKTECFRIINLSDGSEWTLKYHNNEDRYVHLFPARSSQHTFRVKSNTLKSALIYTILIGKDLVTSDDLNKVRPLLGLSPVRDPIDTEAIVEMIEILRS